MKDWNGRGGKLRVIPDEASLRTLSQITSEACCGAGMRTDMKTEVTMRLTLSDFLMAWKLEGRLRRQVLRSLVKAERTGGCGLGAQARM